MSDHVDRAGHAERARFETFFTAAEPQLRAALVSKYGPDLGREATAEALTYGWRNWPRVEAMENGAGYLYRVGDRWALRQTTRQRRRFGVVPIRPDNAWPASASSSVVEPGLGPALAGLTSQQRQAVVLTIGFALTHAEAGRLLGVSRSTIQNHVERGMRKLRHELGAHSEQ